MEHQYDVVIVGGGHNGLVAAAYLARTGLRTLVLERLPHTGGAAVSAQPFAGLDARLSRYSYLVSLLPELIVNDLGLDVELRSRSVASYTPTMRGGAAPVCSWSVSRARPPKSPSVPSPATAMSTPPGRTSTPRCSRWQLLSHHR
ncbi:MAG: FAD-dependent oxidoreductase [Nocardioidaceae bacterium]